MFQKRAREITELVDKTEQEFEVKKKTTGGVIKIGCVESVTMEAVSDIIEEFIKEYPDVRIDMYNGFVDDIKYRIDKGLVDIGILLEPVEISKYDFVRLKCMDNWGLLVPINSALAVKKTIALSEIVEFPLIIPYRAMTRDYILDWFGNVDVNVVATYNIVSNTIFMVEKGMGYALCLDGAMTVRNNSNVKFVPLEPKRTTNSVLVWKKEHSLNKITEQFLNKIKNALKA